MGERNCAFEGCNALEFRTTGYCLNHKDWQFGVSTSKEKSGPGDKGLHDVAIRVDDIIATHENSVEPHLRWWDTEDDHDSHESLDVNPQSPISILMNEERVGWHLIFCLGLVFFFIFWVGFTVMWDPCFGFPGSEPCP